MRDHCIPSIYRRFVNRARFLREHPPFLRALDQTIADWNQRYPAFAIRQRGQPPTERVDNALWGPTPMALQEAIERLNGLRHPPLDTATHELTGEAIGYWGSLLLALCREWWPEPYYPAWFWPAVHPGIPFVAACLVWRPALVPEAWAEPRVIQPMGVRFDPFDPDTQPEGAFWRAAFDCLVDFIAQAIRNRTALTPEWLNEIVEQAFVRASHAESAERSPLAGERMFVPIFSGMTSSDWRAIEASVLAHLARHGRTDSIQAHARRLKAEGMSERQIAGLLGIDRRTVHRLMS